MTFRSPVVIGIVPARFTAQPEYVVNLTPLYYPNPPIPFNQDLWDGATPPKLKATGEAVGTSNPLFTPNPARPFAQYEWRPPARVPLSLKSDVYSYYQPSAALVAQPFSQALWEYPARLAPKATGEINNSIFVETAPLNQQSGADWLNPQTAPRRALVDAFVNLLPVQTIVVTFAPFHQNDWLAAARAAPAQKSDVYGRQLPLFAPNPAQPFTQADWVRAPFAQKAKIDDFVNLLPIQSIVVVVSPPFAQSDWPLTATLRPKITDNSLAALSPLYSPNPSQPFSQNDWPRVHDYIQSDRGLSFGLNQNFPPSPPLILWAQSVT